MASLALPISLVGLAFGVFMALWGFLKARKWEGELKNLQPLIKKAFSIMGKFGKEVQINEAEMKEVEEGAWEALEAKFCEKYPELGLVIAYMEENNPELLDKVRSNPVMLIGLFQKYAPLFRQLTGLTGQQRAVKYDAGV